MPSVSAAKTAGAAAPSQPRRKLSYKEQRELDALPALIDSLEEEQTQLHEQLADGGLYSSDPVRAVAWDGDPTRLMEGGIRRGLAP